MKRVFQTITRLLLVVTLAACASPAPTEMPIPSPQTPTSQPTSPPTRTPTQAPTNTSQPTITPSPTTTPTITPTPEPQPITASNASRLELLDLLPVLKKGVIQNIGWSPDGKSFFIETQNEIQFFDFPSTRLVSTIPGARILRRLANGFYLILKDDQNFLLSLENPVLQELDPWVKQSIYPQNPVFDISADHNYFVLPEGENSVKIREVKTGQDRILPVLFDRMMTFVITELHFSKDGQYLYVVAYGPKNARMPKTYLASYRLPDKKESEIEIGGEFEVSDLGQRFSFRGASLNIYMTEYTIQRSTLPLSLVNRTPGGGFNVYDAVDYTFIEGDTQVAVLYNGRVTNWYEKTSFQDQIILVYHEYTAKILREITNIPAHPARFSITSDNSTVMIVTRDGRVEFWDFQKWEKLAPELQYDFQGTWQWQQQEIAVSQDGRLVAYALPEGIRVVDVATGEPLGIYGDYPTSYRISAAFLGLDQIAVSAQMSNYSQTDAYDLQSGELVYRYSELTDCAFNRQGNVMTCPGKSLWFYNTIDGHPLFNGLAEVWTVSDDGQYIAICNPGSVSVFLYPSQNAQTYSVLQAENQPACGSLAFSPDSSLLVSSTGIIWDIPTGNIVNRFDLCPPDQPRCVYNLQIGPDNRLLLVYPRLIDLETGRTIKNLSPEGRLFTSYFQPDGKTLLLYTSNGLETWGIP